jgi:hypothetical protein
MADEHAPKDKAADPMAAFRELRDGYLDAWAKASVDVVNTEAYAKATGATLETYLSASAPFREALEKSMVQALQQLSMPSRADVLSLAERLVNVEMKLDDMDAKLDQIEKASRPKASAARARKPAPAARKRKGKK